MFYKPHSVLCENRRLHSWQTGTPFTNSDDPDKIPQNADFSSGSMCIMDHSGLTALNFMEKSFGVQWVRYIGAHTARSPSRSIYVTDMSFESRFD